MKTAPHWEKIGLYAHHGINIPLFSIHTKKSSGIGEFLDLIPLIKWCKSIGLDCLQLLPINDTGNDPSPYNPLSSLALDPVYLSIESLGCKEDFPECEEIIKNDIWKKKKSWLKGYFEKTFSSLSKKEEYQNFLNDHPWVSRYALFKCLKEKFGGKHWMHWPSGYTIYDPKLFNEPDLEIDFHCFLQFLCFQQMGEVKAFATDQKFFLKGDVPILISADSADVWEEPHLFNLEVSAGAPPDHYNPLGQNWGFPIFDWDALKKNHYSWWKRRLSVIEKLYHIYRIDHVIGFFRIWTLPIKGNGVGHFLPSDQSLWPIQGKEILEMMIDHCSLLPIAEDLGTVPEIVGPILKELGICGTKVIRWERRGIKKDGEYIPYQEYEPFSMTTLSTPDMDDLEMWWRKYPTESVLFAEQIKKWSYHPLLNRDQRLELLRDAHHTPSYFHINLLQEYLQLFPEYIHPNPEDERINLPGTTLPRNWTYKYIPSIEDLAANKGFFDAFEKILL